MIFYRPHQKSVVVDLKEKGWHGEHIMKFLDYVNKKETLIETGRKNGKHSRDSAKSKVYSAEFKYERTYGYGKKFKNLKEAQKYCDKVLASKTWKKISTAGVKNIALAEMSGSRTMGRAWSHNIDLNRKSGLNQYVLLHEMAHSAGNMHHDVRFRINLLKLVSRFIGSEQAAYLKACFKEKKLKVTESSNIKSPEVWKKGYDRLAAARKEKMLA
tara:strand:- start:1566 stop:2207 length:642 start_codon:yes stop_codon:yes gene_type:complete